MRGKAGIVGKLLRGNRILLVRFLKWVMFADGDDSDSREFGNVVEFRISWQNGATSLSENFLVPTLCSDEGRKVPWVAGNDSDVIRRKTGGQRLSSDDDVDVEGLGVSDWVSTLAGFRPEISSESKCFIFRLGFWAVGDELGQRSEFDGGRERDWAFGGEWRACGGESYQRW